MSLRLAIPRRVALQQSSPPLHQPGAILEEKRKFEKEKPLNCMCANSKLSQQRGSPQGSPHLYVSICVHLWLLCFSTVWGFLFLACFFFQLLELSGELFGL